MSSNIDKVFEQLDFQLTNLENSLSPLELAISDATTVINMHELICGKISGLTVLERLDKAKECEKNHYQQLHQSRQERIKRVNGRV